MKIFIIGLGSIGRRHLKNLFTLGVTDFIVLTKGHCPLPNTDLPNFRKVSSLEAGLAEQPTAIIICNPTSMHLETAMAAARRGCHIFLEKPISHTLEGVGELKDIVGELGLVVQVGFQFRYHLVFQQMKKAIEQGQIGRVVGAQAHWGEYLPDWHPWEDYRNGYSARKDLGGGVLLTLCHPFDYMRFLVGEVEQVSAIGGQLSDLEIDTEDIALVSLKYESGAVGSVYLDYVSRPPKHRVEIIGTDGRIEWDGTFGEAKIYYGGGRKFTVIQPNNFIERNEMFLAEMADFLQCIHSGKTPGCTLEDGIKALRIALMAKHQVSSKPMVSIYAQPVLETS
ncbi:MAG: Gfo/Idh/MocA family oxidoreductase [Bacteroidota bacterium]